MRCSAPRTDSPAVLMEAFVAVTGATVVLTGDPVPPAQRCVPTTDARDSPTRWFDARTEAPVPLACPPVHGTDGRVARTEGRVPKTDARVPKTDARVPKTDARVAKLEARVAKPDASDPP